MPDGKKTPEKDFWHVLPVHTAPGVRPVARSVDGLAPAVAVVQVTEYDVMGEPPSSAGGCHMAMPPLIKLAPVMTVATPGTVTGGGGGGDGRLQKGIQDDKYRKDRTAAVEIDKDESTVASVH